MAITLEAFLTREKNTAVSPMFAPTSTTSLPSTFISYNFNTKVSQITEGGKGRKNLIPSGLSRTSGVKPPALFEEGEELRDLRHYLDCTFYDVDRYGKPVN